MNERLLAISMSDVEPQCAPKPPREGKVVSTIGFILNLLLVAIPKDVFSWLASRRKEVCGQTIVITGGGSGIGARMAEIFALDLGANVAIVDINEKNAPSVAKSICERGGQALAFIHDVTSDKSMEACAAAIHERFGQVDIVICNAAVLFFAHALKLTSAQMQTALNVNIMGVYNTIRAFLPEFEQENRGQIVAISSIAGFYGETYGAAYCPTKFAVRGLMESLQMEFYDRGLNGIKCTTLCPYFVRTPMILNENIRPTSRFIPFMTIDRCCTRAIDAILREKILCFIPGYVYIAALIKNMMSHYVGLAARLWLNCRYNPSKLTTLANSKTSTTLPSPPDALATPPPSPSPPLSSSPPPSERAQRKSSSAGASARPSSAAAIAAAAANACVSHSAKIDNEKKRSSQTSARRPPPQIAEMANYFRVPHPIWWLTILPALALNFIVFYNPQWIPVRILGYVGDFCYWLGTEHNTLIYYIFVGAVIAHFAEATYVLYLCDSLKFTHKCSLKWFVQTMLLGFPSTLLIRAHRNRVLKNRD